MLKEDSRWIEAGFNRLFFDLPVAYGWHPERALQILLVFMLLFVVPYSFAFAGEKRSFSTGIWRVWLTDATSLPSERAEPELIKVKPLKSLPYGLYFSLLSAFHIGWRGFNVGTWITRIQPRAFALQPVGSVRTISGVQSLLSVYLLAIWLLSYFGRPFG